MDGKAAHNGRIGMPRSISSSLKDPHCKAGYRYAEQIISGKIPACGWVQKACQRSIDDYRKQKTPEFPFRFDADRGGRVCRFIESLCHIKGAQAGRLIKLEPWQAWLVTQIMGWFWDRGEREGRRRFRRAFCECPRGNGKSLILSAFSLYFLAADGESGSECFAAAVTRDQARIVFDSAREMARRSPDLCQALGIQINAHTLTVIKTASKFLPLSSEGNSLDGLNIQFAAIDELAQHPSRCVWDALETGAGKRESPLLFMITTAGSDIAGIGYEIHTYLTKILDRVQTDESFFGIIYGVDAEDDWQLEATWKKANPNYNVSVYPEHISDMVKKAQAMPSAQAAFRMKHLDEWMSADSPFFDMAAWSKCIDTSLKLEDFQKTSVVVAVDLATKTDMAAKVLLFQKTINHVQHYYGFATHYLPEAATQDGRNSQYFGWQASGLLSVTPGDVLDFATVENDILNDMKQYKVTHVAFDPWQATMLSQRLADQGANMLEFRNTVQNMSAPMKEIDSLTRSGRFHFNGDPILLWQASNVVAHYDLVDNVRPNKERLDAKIDAVVALIFAMGVILNEPVTESPYEDFRPLAYASFR